MKLKEFSEYITKNVKNILNNVDEGKIENIINAIIKAKKIFVYGVGRSGLCGKAFALRLSHLGLNVYVLGETITPPVEEEDVVMLISGSGKTASVVKTAEIIRKINAKIIGITANKNSPLEKLSDIAIFLKIEEKNKMLAPLGTIFETTAWNFLDLLITELMIRLNETEESMSKRHATLE